MTVRPRVGSLGERTTVNDARGEGDPSDAAMWVKRWVSKDRALPPFTGPRRLTFPVLVTRVVSATRVIGPATVMSASPFPLTLTAQPTVRLWIPEPKAAYEAGETTRAAGSLTGSRSRMGIPALVVVIPMARTPEIEPGPSSRESPLSETKVRSLPFPEIALFTAIEP